MPLQARIEIFSISIATSSLQHWTHNTDHSKILSDFRAFEDHKYPYTEDHGQWKQYQRRIAKVSIAAVVIISALQISKTTPQHVRDTNEP